LRSRSVTGASHRSCAPHRRSARDQLVWCGCDRLDQPHDIVLRWAHGGRDEFLRRGEYHLTAPGGVRDRPADVVNAIVVAIAVGHQAPVVTSDPGDLAHIADAIGLKSSPTQPD
jgi:hypothetical protein